MMPPETDTLLNMAEKTLVFFICLGWIAVCGAFVFKVWNERQMTHAYHAQTLEQRRIADALETFSVMHISGQANRSWSGR